MNPPPAYMYYRGLGSSFNVTITNSKCVDTFTVLLLCDGTVSASRAGHANPSGTPDVSSSILREFILLWL